MAEYWDVLDENRKPTGRLHRRGVRLKNGDYHLICEAWLLSPCGKLLVTQRHPDKNHGGMWECTGGAVIAGETSKEAIKREIKEEIGVVVTDDELKFVGSSSGPTYFVDYYTVCKDVDISDLRLQAEEVSDAKFVTKEEFNEMKRKGLLLPHLYEFMIESKFEFLN